MNILIVDDQQTNIDLLERLVKKLGEHTIKSFTDSPKALEWAKKNSVDLFYVDYQMPDLNGVHFIENIRKTPINGNSAVILVSSSTEKHIFYEALDAGAHDFLTRPFDAAEFLARSRNLIKLRKEEQKLQDRALHLESEIGRATEALRTSEERYALATKAAHEGLWDWDLQKGRIYYSKQWKKMIGFREDEDECENIPTTWLNRVHPEDYRGLVSAIDHHLNNYSETLNWEYRLRHRDGSYRWMVCRGIAIRDEKGEAIRFVGSQRDISDRKEVEEQLLHNSFHDPLTGLPNRSLFNERLEQAFIRYKRDPSQQFAVLFLDLDRLKQINDSLGHSAGDQLLKLMGPRLLACCREADTVARWSGDEFTILLFDTESMEDIDHFCERLLKTISRPIIIQHQEIVVSASIGIAKSDPYYKHAIEMIQDADLALYRAKSEGRDRYVLFHQEMRGKGPTPFQYETNLKHALEKNQILFYYQPILDLKTQKTTGFEALMRWRHPQFGLVPPDDFIPLAEESGLIIDLGDYAIECAVAQLKKWHKTVDPDLKIFINIAKKQLFQKDFVVKLSNVLAKNHVAPHHVVLEFSESTLIESLVPVEEILKTLSEKGIKVALDDFGAGRASLNTLPAFPFDYVKIDRSMITRLAKNPKAQRTLSLVSLIAKNLKFKIISEGIETKSDADEVHKLGHEYGQGYLYSPARPAEDLKKFLKAPPAKKHANG